MSRRNRQRRRSFRYRANSPLDAMVQEPNSERKASKRKPKKGVVPPEIILDYQYPNDSLLRVRVVKQMDEDGEVSYAYEQSTEVDAMEQPVWEAALSHGDNPETVVGRLVDLLGGVICGEIKTFPPT